MFAVDRREGDEGTPVARPRHHLRQPRQGNMAGEYGARPYSPGQHRQSIDGRSPVAPWLLERRRWIDLEFDEPLHPVERVGEDPLDSRSRAVEIRQDRKVRPAGLREQHRRSAGAKQPALDLGDLEMGVDGMIDGDKLPPHQRATGRFMPEGLHAGLK